MDISTIVAVLALLGTIVGNIIAITRFSTKQEVTLASVQAAFKEFKENIHTSIKDLKIEVNEKISKNQEETSKHFDRLEQKQDKHNNFITRIYEIEKNQGITEEKIDVANHRIHDLEELIK